MHPLTHAHADERALPHARKVSNLNVHVAIASQESGVALLFPAGTWP